MQTYLVLVDGRVGRLVISGGVGRFLVLLLGEILLDVTGLARDLLSLEVFLIVALGSVLGLLVDLCAAGTGIVTLGVQVGLLRVMLVLVLHVLLGLSSELLGFVMLVVVLVVRAVAQVLVQDDVERGAGAGERTDHPSTRSAKARRGVSRAHVE